MKNLKSKIASLLSVALLGTSLIVPSVFADETTEEPAVTTYKTAYEQDFTEQGLTKDILKSQGWTIDSSFGFGTSGLGGWHTTSEQYATYDADAGSNYKLSGQLYVSFGDNGMSCEMAKDSAGKAVSITFKANKPSVLSCNGSTATFDMTINTSTTYTYTFECNDKTVTATLSNGTTTETKSLTLDSQIMPYVRWTMNSFSDMKLKSMKLEVPSDYPLYKTVYEQNFQQAGLTVDDVTSDGWVIKNMTPSTSYGLKGASGSSAIYTMDLGTKYKVSGSFWFDANGVQFYYGGTVKNGAYSGGKQITMDRNGASGSKLDGDVMNVTFPAYTVLNYEFTCNENVVTFLVKKSDGTVVVNQSKTYNSPLESNCICWYFDGYAPDVRLNNIKIKVADDYKEYVTTYSRNFIYSTDEAPYTEDEIKAEGWVYSDFMSPTKSNGLYASTTTEQHAYAWYNKDLGTKYIADLEVTRNYYNEERFFFNATLDSTYGVVSGYAVQNHGDWGSDTIKLYKYVNGKATKVAESAIGLGGACPLSIHIEYDNGKIFVKETKASDSKVPTITYDATADIAANPELASGVIGGKSYWAKKFGTGNDFYAVRSLTVQQPDTENKLSTLIVNVADDNTVTYSVKGNNKTSEKLDAIIIVAAYDVNGQLLGVDISGQYIGSLGVQAVTGTFACSEAPANVKAFLIDGFKNLRPLASAILKNIE